MKRPLDLTPFSSLSLWDLPLELVMSIFWILFPDFEEKYSSYKTLFRLEIVSKTFREYVISFANLAENLPEQVEERIPRKRLEIYHPNLKRIILSHWSTIRGNDISAILSQSLTTLVISSKWSILSNKEDGPLVEDSDLKQLSNLTHLSLASESNMSDTGLKHLTQLTTLQLDYYQEITGIGICPFKIQNLYLDSNSFNLSLIKTFQNLVELRFGDNIEVVDSYFLENMLSLKSLSINKSQKITNSLLGSLTNLTSLGLFGNECITDDGLKPLVNLCKLDLSFNGSITNQALENLTNLTTLNLNGNDRITNSIFAYLPNITSLSLNRSCVTNDFVHFVPNLTCLSVTSIPENINTLVNLVMLRIFIVEEESGEREDKFERLENLHVLCLPEPRKGGRIKPSITGDYPHSQPYLKFLQDKYESIIVDKDKWEELTSSELFSSKFC